jgi:large subunit ribosomal protein L7/L12
MTKEEMIAAIEQMTVLELADLVKALEEKFGVSAAPMAVAAAPAEAAAPVEAEEEKTEFDVVLKEVGSKKIQVIKAVRQITNLNLRDAKTVVDEAPSTVLQGISKEAAEEAKAKLEAEGATVELK